MRLTICLLHKLYDQIVKKYFTLVKTRDTIVDGVNQVELALHMDKKGSLSPSEPASVQDSETALAEIQDNIKLVPISAFVDIRNASEALPLLDGVERLQLSSRGLVCKIIEFLSESSNFSKSMGAMCHELGFKTEQVWYIERRWPHFWRFINLMVRRAVRDRTEARVEGATAQAAIHGNDRDRRLYYEVHGRLKRHDKEQRSGNIIFVNNIIDRPSVPDAVTVDIASPSAEASSEPE